MATSVGVSKNMLAVLQGQDSHRREVLKEQGFLHKEFSQAGENVKQGFRGQTLLNELTKRATNTLQMHLPEHFVNVADRVKAVKDILQQREAKVVALVGMGGIGM